MLFLKVIWKKEDREVLIKVRIDVILVGSKFEIRNVVYEDGGIYFLIVENLVGLKIVLVKVFVLGKNFNIYDVFILIIY